MADSALLSSVDHGRPGGSGGHDTEMMREGGVNNHNHKHKDASKQQKAQNEKPPSLTSRTEIPTKTMTTASPRGGGDEKEEFGGTKGTPPAGSGAVISIDDAIEKLGMGRFQTRILWAAGLCFAADSMEVLLLSFLAVIMQSDSEWLLSDDQTSWLVSSVFAGAMIGTLVLGRAGDEYGRRPVFIATSSFISLFGFLTALVPGGNYPCMVLARFFVGFGVGGLTVPFDTLAEFIPDANRGTDLLAVEYFWTAGTLTVPLLAYVSLGRHGDVDVGMNDGGEEESVDQSWRAFVALCAVPCLMSTLMGYLVVPESPRWLVTSGDGRKGQDEALRILRQAAERNGKDPYQLFPEGTTLVAEYGEAIEPLYERRVDDRHSPAAAAAAAQNRTSANSGESHDFRDLFQPKWRGVTLPLWGTWAGFAFSYYGTIMLVTMVFASGAGREQQQQQQQQQQEQYQDYEDYEYGDYNDNDGDGVYSFDYVAIFASAASEIVGTTLVIWNVDRVGRVPSQAAAYLAGGISVFSLCCLAGASADGGGDDDDDGRRPHHGALMALAFLARMSFMAGSCATWCATAEILSTEIRTTGHAAANAVARLGGSLSPFLVTRHTPYAAIGACMLSVSLLTSLCSWNLPETKGKPMGSSVVDPRVVDDDKNNGGRKDKLSPSTDDDMVNANAPNGYATNYHGMVWA